MLSAVAWRVRRGKPAYEETFGLPFWEDLNAHLEIAASFDELSEFRELAREAGLEIIAAGRQPSGLCVVESDGVIWP